MSLLPSEQYKQAARDFAAAFDGDQPALERLNRHYSRRFTHDDLKAEVWRRVYAFRQRSWKAERAYLAPAEAQLIVAQDAGFSSWTALEDAIAAGTPPPGTSYFIDRKHNRIGPRRQLSDGDWEMLIGMMREQRIPALESGGLMTDAVLARIAELDHVTSLNLEGSRGVSDEGLRHLSRMPQLQDLNLGGTKATDQGLGVLRELRNLRTFQMCWHGGLSDDGAANLRYCDQLEDVNLMGSRTGDGLIEALQGKQQLRHLRTGRLVTDAGIPPLHNIPLLKNWNGTGAHLLLDGPITNNGLATLKGSEGIVDLDLFWHVTETTSDGFAHLAALPNLTSLGCDGKLSDDGAMGHIAALPRLERLRAQESVATDDGWEALSRSRTLQFLWGRVCPHFGDRGFLALSKLPTLRGIGIGCANVSDEALARLPDFPALEELTPIGFNDEGFRHAGKCKRIHRLTCMYCRDTTDRATEYVTELPLKYYYAGLTKITDRSLELLGRITTLEQIDFYECQSITNAGLSYLAKLPNLREVHLDSLPGVTLEGTGVFPARVQVYYST